MSYRCNEWTHENPILWFTLEYYYYGERNTLRECHGNNAKIIYPFLLQWNDIKSNFKGNNAAADRNRM